jgi:hypothetical protein
MNAGDSSVIEEEENKSAEYVENEPEILDEDVKLTEHEIRSY